MLIASYAPVGDGVMLLCQLVVAVPSSLLVVGLLLSSGSRMRRPKYWVALLCFAQAIPSFLVLRNLGPFSQYFVLIWLGSMGLLLVGFLVLALWPARRKNETRQGHTSHP
jgi:hypothetical protein